MKKTKVSKSKSIRCSGPASPLQRLYGRRTCGNTVWLAGISVPCPACGILYTPQGKRAR